MSPAQNHKPGFSLIELLVVITLVTILISTLIPTLSKARDQADATQCSANLRQIGVCAGAYTADYKNWTAPPFWLGWRDGATGTAEGNGMNRPDIFINKGLTGYVYSLSDFYIAADYVPMGRVAGAPGSKLFICPKADKLGAGRHASANGAGGFDAYSQTESHYSYTPLLTDKFRPSAPSYNNYRRCYGMGPYRAEEIRSHAETFFAGDGVLLTGYEASTASGSLAVRKTWGWENIGRAGPSWGAVSGPTLWGTTISNTYIFTNGVPTSFTHEDFANTLYFDGHAARLKPAPYISAGNLDWTYAPNFTNDLTGRCYPPGVSPLHTTKKAL
jgi:prepilin-type N-terminal cleavage/methylation domain-containing protein/prepilin-type processing-associated H-X9-DG protein